MKKVIIGILIIIPLLIVLTVGLVTAFVSLSVEIGVESVSLDKSELSLELSATPYRISDLLSVTVMPEKASDKSYEWSIANVHSRDPQYADGDNGKDDFWFVRLLDDNMMPADTVSSGYLEINVHCSFELVVTAQTHSARCLVTVGQTISSVLIQCDDTSLVVGEHIQLGAVVTPLDGTAVAMYWTTDNPNVASVDKNGLLTAVGVGEAQIMLGVENSDGEIIDATPVVVTVTAGYTKFGNAVYTHLRSISFDELRMSPEIVDETTNCTVEGDYLVIDDEAERAVVTTTDGGVVMFAVCGQYDITIAGAEYFGSEYVLETQGLPLYLSVKYVSDFMRDVQPDVVSWSSSDENVALIDKNGVVNAVNSGDVVIYATVDTPEGSRSASLELSVRRKVAVLISGVTDITLSAGLARETIVPSQKLENGAFVANAFEVEVAYPKRGDDESEEAFYEAFLFETDKPEYAYFDNTDGDGTNNNLLLFNHDALKENGGVVEIVVTVSARYPKYPNLPSYTTASFTVKVAAGVAVADYASLKTVAADEQVRADELVICLVDNIVVENAAGSDKAQPIELFNDLYGNGYMISAEKGQIPTTEGIFAIRKDGHLISNITLRANSVEEGETLNASTFRDGYCLTYREYNGHRLTDVQIEYSLLENARSALVMGGSDLYITGTVLRNTSGVGIVVHMNMTKDGNGNITHLTYDKIHVHNCVASNMASSVFNFLHANMTMDDLMSVPAENRTSFTQTGFFDVYNWQNVNDFNLIPQEDLESALSGTGLSSDAILAYLREIVRTDDAFAPFRVMYNGETYLHMGFISTGLQYPSCLMSQEMLDKYHAEGMYDFVTEPTLVMEDTRFGSVRSCDIDNTIIGLLQKAYPYAVHFFSYTNTVTDLTPGKTYVINTAFIDRLHS